MDIKNTIFNPKFYQHFLPSLLIRVVCLHLVYALSHSRFLPHDLTISYEVISRRFVGRPRRLAFLARVSWSDRPNPLELCRPTLPLASALTESKITAGFPSSQYSRPLQRQHSVMMWHLASRRDLFMRHDHFYFNSDKLLHQVNSLMNCYLTYACMQLYV